MKGASNIAPMGVRIPDDLKEKIQERARKNGRSMNAEILKILEDAVTLPAVRVQSEFNVDLYSENPADSGKITVSRKQLMDMVNKSVQEAIDASAESLSKSMAEATFNSLAEKYDFVPKKKPT